MLFSFKKISVLFFLLIISQANNLAIAHCQIPCGIYNDHARVQSMLEDASTIEKAITSISSLSGKADAQSQNQLIRWVNNKEKHAQNIIDTISDYFLTQRVKPSQKNYAERLRKHHHIILSAMQVKQKTDPKIASELIKNIEAISPYYPEHKH